MSSELIRRPSTSNMQARRGEKVEKGAGAVDMTETKFHVDPDRQSLPLQTAFCCEYAREETLLFTCYHVTRASIYLQ